MNRQQLTWIWVLASLLVASCARMGNPDGGWFDEKPPRIIFTVPEDQTTSVTGRKIQIFFDEYIKIENPSEKVVISPPQLEQPEIKGQGKRITVELKDSLKKNTTYTIDFSDAIVDNNEGNPLGNYTFTFSTGDHIDTMEVAGYVVDAQKLEPVKGIQVGLYPADSLTSARDTSFTSHPLLRVSNTDERGHFVIKGVADGHYRVYALMDQDGNYIFNAKSEMIAYDDNVVRTSCKPDIRQDTIWSDSLHIRDIIQEGYTHFLPDDVMLRAFTEEQTDRYFLKSERPLPERFTLYFSYGHPDLPKVRGLDFDDENAFIVEPTAHQDTITYWLRDTALVNRDTLSIELSYMATDTLGVLRQQTDTLDLIAKTPYAKRMKQQQEAFEKWQKQQERNKKRGKEYQTEMPPQALQPEYHVAANIAPDQNPYVTMPVPLARIDTAAIHLYQKVDSMWYRTPFLFGEMPGRARTYQLVAEWTMGTEYSLEIDSAAFADIYGKVSAGFKQGFKVRKSEDFGTLSISLSNFNDASAVYMQLLDKTDKIIKEVVTHDGRVLFHYVLPGTYYLSMYVDVNGNGRWDTGDYAADRQPEPVYYYPEKIECRAKWDVKQTWNPTATPLNLQKPSELVKQNGSKNRKTIRNRNEERARKLGIPPPAF